MLLTKELLRTAFNMLRLAFISIYDDERAAAGFYVYVRELNNAMCTEVEKYEVD